MKYTDLMNLFQRSKDKTVGKKIAGNTWVVKMGDNYGIKLYDTIIMIFKMDGSITLNSGGYRTRTTKDRINEFSGIQVTQENGLWYVHARDQVVLFTDNMVIPPHGPIGDDASIKTITADKKAVDRMVKRYVRGFVDDMLINGIPDPSGGDCWYCLMRSVDNPNDLEPMGYSHYFSHFEEKYYVPTIFYKAVNENNYPNPGLILSMMRSNKDFLKREGTHVLQKFFRRRKLGMVAAMSVKA